MGATDITLSDTGIWTGGAPEIHTAGEAIDLHMAVYLNPGDNRIYKAVGNDANKYKIYGFAGSRAMAAGQKIMVNTQRGGRITGLTGLTAGAPYFLSDTTAGALQRVADVGAADYSSFAGYAFSATVFEIWPTITPVVHA